MFYFYDDDFINKMEKPLIQPPKWIFKYIWSVLFLLMAASFIIILFQETSAIKYAAIAIFFVQLFLNIFWTKVFFKEHDLKKAFVTAVILTIIVFLMIIYFFKLSFLAGLLQLPYLFWLVFACILNRLLIKLNIKKTDL